MAEALDYPDPRCWFPKVEEGHESRCWACPEPIRYYMDRCKLCEWRICDRCRACSDPFIVAMKAEEEGKAYCMCPRQREIFGKYRIAERAAKAQNPVYRDMWRRHRGRPPAQ